ncbi:MAG: MutS-related protein, partial [Trebonia sp.]
MKVFLLHEDRDFAVKPGLRDAIFGAMASGDLFALTSARRDLQRARSSGPVAAAPGNDDVLTQDLELQTLWNTMAAGDEFLFEMAKRGMLESAELAKGNKGRRYIVRTQREQRWTERLPFGNRSPGYSFTIPARDENGFRALEEIRGKGINRVADAVAQSADHVKSFFSMLRIELAFYLGCLNLRERLAAKGEPACFPAPLPAGQLTLAAEGIYDVCLTLHLPDRVVGNDVNADGKSLVMITGANQGGKSTLLRSLGLAHLMMQSGMFVGAQSFRASLCAAVFTHYKREEDAAMHSGKLDEELARMSEIAGQITPRSILLCNESFASTNEREGSEIARQVVRA